MTLPPLIPRELLYGNPSRSNPRISHDGRRLGYLAPLDGVMNVWVGAVGSEDFKPVTHDSDRPISSFWFAHDNRHLMWIQDKGGDENWRLYDVDLETLSERDLTPFDGVQVQLIAHRKERPDEVILGINERDRRLHDVFHLDLRTGVLEKVLESPGFIGWVADGDLVVRAAMRPRDDGGRDVMVRDDEASEWRVAQPFALEDDRGSAIGFTRDGRGLFVRSAVDANTMRVIKIDLPTGAIEVVSADPEYDVGGVVVDPDSREIQWADFEKDRSERVVLDPSIEADVAALDQVQRGDWSLLGRDHADRTWVIGYRVDDGPISYYLWDRQTKQATLLFDHRPELRTVTLAEMEPFEFRARDGLTIRGYLTFPPGVERSALPAVLHVHGGPWSRDVWGFAPTPQLLSNRGYLCVQVNYRGSTGYGKAFVNAGNREWGGKMHDDLIDAVEWVVAQGYADRDRLAIMGGSYGGYATLVGATFTPDVFRCAIAAVAPANLKTLMESFPPYWQPTIALWHGRVGNHLTEPDFLWSRSPLSRVDQIKCPMLIAHGANDPRVALSESEQIVAAMKEKGIEHEFILFPDEGHGFSKPENNMRFRAAAEAFLAKHLGGRCESA